MSEQPENPVEVNVEVPAKEETTVEVNAEEAEVEVDTKE